MKMLYPFVMRLSGIMGRKKHKKNPGQIIPPVSLYQLEAQLLNGDRFSFNAFKGKKILIVNTASNCGYTDQLNALNQLFEKKKDQLMIIAFPSNDFKEQEKGSNEEVAQFCTTFYQLKFPVAKKTVVSTSPQQHPLYAWLTNKELNGWNEQAPSWNFSKYLINEAGMLTDYFDPGFDPAGSEIALAINT